MNVCVVDEVYVFHPSADVAVNQVNPNSPALSGSGLHPLMCRRFNVYGFSM